MLQPQPLFQGEELELLRMTETAVRPGCNVTPELRKSW